MASAGAQPTGVEWREHGAELSSTVARRSAVASFSIVWPTAEIFPRPKTFHLHVTCQWIIIVHFICEGNRCVLNGVYRTPQPRWEYLRLLRESEEDEMSRWREICISYVNVIWMRWLFVISFHTCAFSSQTKPKKEKRRRRRERRILQRCACHKETKLFLFRFVFSFFFALYSFVGKRVSDDSNDCKHLAHRYRSRLPPNMLPWEFFSFSTSFSSSHRLPLFYLRVLRRFPSTRSIHFAVPFNIYAIMASHSSEDNPIASLLYRLSLFIKILLEQFEFHRKQAYRPMM